MLVSINCGADHYFFQLTMTARRKRPVKDAIEPKWCHQNLAKKAYLVFQNVQEFDNLPTSRLVYQLILIKRYFLRILSLFEVSIVTED